MNPSVSAFEPGPTPEPTLEPTLLPDASMEELQSANKSLCKALAEARQAHSVTKLALEDEVAKRAKAEEDRMALLKTNNSLVSTAQMLGAIVKHNIKTPETATVPSHSILYDVLEHQRAEYQRTGYPEGEEGEDTVDVTPASTTDPEVTHDDKVTDHAELASSPIRGNDTLKDTTNIPRRTIAVPYQCRPNWSVSQNRPIFDSDQELARASQQSSGPQMRQSVFWQHPVRYLPASDEKNLCRTLIIDFLPLGTTLKDVLALIRGGALESIQLLEPIGHVTDFKTARVVFHYELPADDMLLHWQKYGLTVRGQPIRVLQLGYSYPKNRQLDEDVFIRCYTRILLIDNISDRVIQRLPAYLDQQMKMGFIVEIGQTDDGITMVEFTSVAEAAKAMRAMQTEEIFYGAVFEFEDDYCEQGSYAD